MSADTQVLILAAGTQARWESERKFPVEHKQLLHIGGNETIIGRIIKQCRNRGTEPLIITQHVAIQQAIDTMHFEPSACRWTVETLRFSPWRDRTIVLLGDVVYSRPLMDRIFDDNISLVVYGHLYEIFAVSFDIAGRKRVRRALHQAIKHAESGGKGTLRKFYHALHGVDLDDDSIENELLSYVDYMQDYTRDVDTPEDYIELLNKVVRTGAINDE